MNTLKFIVIVSGISSFLLPSLYSETYRTLTFESNYRTLSFVDAFGVVRDSGDAVVRVANVVAEPYVPVEITSADGSDTHTYLVALVDSEYLVQPYCVNFDNADHAWGFVAARAEYTCQPPWQDMGYVFPTFSPGFDGGLSSRQSGFFVHSYYYQ